MLQHDNGRETTQPSVCIDNVICYSLFSPSRACATSFWLRHPHSQINGIGIFEAMIGRHEFLTNKSWMPGTSRWLANWMTATQLWWFWPRLIADLINHQDEPSFASTASVLHRMLQMLHHHQPLRAHNFHRWQMNFNMPSFSGMAGGLQGFEAPMTRAEAGAASHEYTDVKSCESRALWMIDMGVS